MYVFWIGSFTFGNLVPERWVLKRWKFFVLIEIQQGLYSFLFIFKKIYFFILERECMCVQGEGQMERISSSLPTELEAPRVLNPPTHENMTWTETEESMLNQATQVP